MTKNIKDRKDLLQTGNVDNIITLHECKTSNGKLLEQIIHDVLHKYRCDNGREHFFSDLGYTKMIIDILEAFFDTLKSSYHNITKEELLEKINEKLLYIKNKTYEN
jgi:hypothetical protein